MKHKTKTKSLKKGDDHLLNDQKIDVVQQQKVKGGYDPWIDSRPDVP